MASKEASTSLPATHSGPRPSDFPLGSMESRAAARAVLSAKSEQPREVVRIVATGTCWEPIPDKNEAWRMPPLDLEKSTCSRTLDSDGTLWEFVEVHGDRDQLTDEALERWIKSFPIERRAEHYGEVRT